MAIDLDEYAAASSPEADAPSMVPDSIPVIPDDWIAADEPRALEILRPRRSVVRRAMSRSFVGLIALAVFAAWVAIPRDSRPAAEPAPVDAAESQDAPAAPAAAVAGQSADAQPALPSWLSPQMLYAPPIAAPPPSAADAAVHLPVPRPLRRP